ncbi:hypothetical protein OSTOST_03080 [Ostertagia ostertagi]
MINGILVACLTGYGYVERSAARQAHFICGEMAVVGKHYTCFQDNTSGAYVTLTDIPNHVVTFINGVIEEMNGEVTITAKYVWIFMNDVLRRYFSTPLWTTSREMQISHVGTSAPDNKEKQTLATILKQSQEVVVKQEELGDDELKASTSSSHIKVVFILLAPGLGPFVVPDITLAVKSENPKHVCSFIHVFMSLIV